MTTIEWLKLQWDRASSWVLAAAGAIALIVGWVGVSGSGYPAEELPYIISGGLGGVFLLGLAATLWLSADLRDEWTKLDRIEQRLARIEEGITEVERIRSTPTMTSDPAGNGSAVDDAGEIAAPTRAKQPRNAATAARAARTRNPV